MKKFLLLLTIVALLVFAACATAGAQAPTVKNLALADLSAPTVTAVGPTPVANDIDAPVTITGTGFVATPTVTLGDAASTHLTHVTWESSTTLTATVPWGISASTYPLTVTNPDGGSGSGALTIAESRGQWNAGDLFGGEIYQLLRKPGDPNTIYATAFGVIGLFRSGDNGETWAFVSDKVWANNNKLAVDPNNPDWIYAYTPNGLMRSQNDGDTWVTLTSNPWLGASQLVWPQVYVSPWQPADHDQTLFVSSAESYGAPDPNVPLGLTKSIDGGTIWAPVPDLNGVSVQDIAFDPNHPNQLVAVTSGTPTLGIQLYQSTDYGDHWTTVATTGLTPTSLGAGGSITYDPSGTNLWIDAFAQGTSGGLFKCLASELTGPTGGTSSWHEVSAVTGRGSWSLAFAKDSDTSVYISRYRTINGGEPNGGTSWGAFGPSTWYGYGTILLDPNHSDTTIIADDSAGLLKTTNGGTDWVPKVQGLTALSCNSMAVSKFDPLRVYATFAGPQGIYRSDDGTSNWTYLPVDGSSNVRQVLADPFDPQRVYMGADSGFYASTQGGDAGTWSAKGWNGLPDAHGMLVTMAADPHNQGHLLASFGGGSYGIGEGALYKSDDWGANWHAVTSSANWIRSIVFDPDQTGWAYIATSGGGIYKSTNGGENWTLLSNQPTGVANAATIAIATSPQRTLFVGGQSSDDASAYPWRSTDDGATWVMANRKPSGGDQYAFANNDSTRLYFASPQGLFFSSDLGDTWEPSSGAFGHIQTTAVGFGNASDHTILYAATTGGDAGTGFGSGAPAKAGRKALGATNTLVSAGIYRYAQTAQQATTCALTKKSGTISYAAKTTITGTLKVAGTTMGLRGCYAQLQSSSNGSTYVNAGAPRMTAAGGAFSFTVAPTTKTYYRVKFAGSGNFYQAATSAKIYLIPRVYLTAPSAPSVAYRYRAFTSTALLKPRHTARTYAVKLQCYRYERQRNGTYKWVLRKTVSAKAANYSSYTKVAARFSLPSAGKWRVRAYHAADTKNAVTYSTYRYLRVR
jgi:photosystem II stability/assembly factor-like uncharacterized protein